MGSWRLRGGPGSIGRQIQSTHGSACSPASEEACPKHYRINSRKPEEALCIFDDRTARHHWKADWCCQYSRAQVFGLSCLVDLADGLPEQIAAVRKETAGRHGLDPGSRVLEGHGAVFT